MTFREQLDKVNELGISICDLTIANECDCVFDFEYTEEQFEKLCTFAIDCYLKSEYLTENAIARTINELITEEEKTIEQVLSMNKRTFNVRASYSL